MKYLSFLLLVACFMVGCAETPSRPDPVMTQAQHDAINAESAIIQAQKANQASIAAASSPSTLHYYCTAHPTKGGGDQGSCPDCGLALVHNQAFHNTPTTPGAPVTSGAITPGAVTPTAGAATNAAGVFHYTCASGCAGGAAAQANCATCGNPLAHNQAFHN